MGWVNRRFDETTEGERRVEVVIPVVDVFGNMGRHQENYDSAIAAMSPSRTFGAEFSKTSFRRLIAGVDPKHDNGWAFQGQDLPAGQEATVPVGSIILAVDRSFAKGNWYARQRVETATVVATLYEVAENGEMKEVIQDTTRAWARKITGWLVTQRPDLPKVTVTPRTRR